MSSNEPVEDEQTKQQEEVQQQQQQQGGDNAVAGQAEAEAGEEQPSAGPDPLDLDEGHGGSEEGGSGGPEINTSMDSSRKRQLDAEETENLRLLQMPVPLAYCLKHIEEDAEGRILTRQLVLYIFFLVVLTLYGFSRRSTSEEHFATAGLWEVLGNYELSPQKYYNGAALNSGTHYPKPFRDLSNPGDWQDWFEDVFIPSFFDPLNRTARFAKKGPLATHQLVGGIRVTTYRVAENADCIINEEYYPSAAYPRQCFNVFDEDSLDKEPITGIIDPATGLNKTIEYVEGCNHPFQEIWGRLDTYPCGGHKLEISGNSTFDEVMSLARQMRSIGFVNMTNSRFVLVDFITFVEGLDTFVSGKFYVEITSGGGWVPTSRIKAFHMWTDTGKHKNSHVGSLVLDIIFILFVTYYWLRLLRYFFFGRENPRSLRFFFDLWNLVDFLNLIGLVCNIAFHLQGRAVATEFQKVKGFTLPQTEGYFEELNYVMELYYLEVYFIALNTIIAYLKILMYLRLNPRLNILTRTLTATAQDIVGVLIIFTLLVTAYAATGYVLYGTALLEFHNTSYSFSSLFLMLLGAFDYAQMRQEQQNFTFIFFWSYILLALFAMLNFITAIIGTGFNEEVAKTVALPLPAQLRRARKRLANAKPCQSLCTLCSRQRFREDIITDFLVEYRRALLSADNLTMDSIRRGDEDEPEYIITRVILGQMIPQKEVDYITDEVLDDLWLEVAEDYELDTSDEVAQEEERLAKAYEDGMGRAFVNVFLSKRAELTKTQNVLLHGKNGGADEEQLFLDAKNISDAQQSQREQLLGGSSSNDPFASSRRLQRRASGADLNASSQTDNASSQKTAGDNRPKVLNSEDATLALLGDAGAEETDPAVLAAIQGIVSRDEAKARLQSSQSTGIQNLGVRVKQLEVAMATVEMLLNKASHKIVASTGKKK